MLFISSKGAKKLWLNKEMFFLDAEGILRNIHKKQGDNRLVVPRQFVQEVLSMCHDLPASGHQATSRTYARVKEKYYWYDMSRATEQFVKSCTRCIRHKKANRKAKCPMTRYHTGVPIERVHLDFLGPLPESTSGNTNILAMVDQFTKWVECIALPSQRAEVTARATVNQFFARFGYPFNLFTDQGRNFEGRLFKSICEILQIHKNRTTPYRPSANGQVERFNRTLMDAVRCIVNKSQDNWDEHLSQLAGAIRSSMNRSTGFTPNKLILGREVNLPADLVFRPPDAVHGEDHEDYVNRLQGAIRLSNEITRNVLTTHQARMKRDYDVRIREQDYKPSDLFYVLDTAKIKGRAKKLDPPWKGPGIVVEKLSSYVYTVKLKAMPFTTNHDRLKHCQDPEIPAWLRRCQHRLRDGENILETEDGDILCICKKSDDGGLLIQCETCDDWFHGRCVGIATEIADTLVTHYYPRRQLEVKK
jgi:transposase InsO family protein